jgi:acid stress chaperone HdeB
MRYLLIALVLLSAPARAAGVDMSTLTCQDWIDADDDAQDLMTAWLRGYLAGRSTATLFDVGRERADAQALRAYCQGHPQTGVVSAASQWGK